MVALTVVVGNRVVDQSLKFLEGARSLKKPPLFATRMPPHVPEFHGSLCIWGVANRLHERLKVFNGSVKLNVLGRADDEAAVLAQGLQPCDTSAFTSAVVPKGRVCCSSMDPQKQSLLPYSFLSLAGPCSWAG